MRRRRRRRRSVKNNCRDEGSFRSGGAVEERVELGLICFEKFPLQARGGGSSKKCGEGDEERGASKMKLGFTVQGRLKNLTKLLESED